MTTETLDQLRVRAAQLRECAGRSDDRAAYLAEMKQLSDLEAQIRRMEREQSDG